MQRPKEFLLPLEHLFMQPIHKKLGVAAHGLQR